MPEDSAKRRKKNICLLLLFTGTAYKSVSCGLVAAWQLYEKKQDAKVLEGSERTLQM